MTEAQNRGQGQEGLRFPVRYGLPVTAVTPEAINAVVDLYYDVMFPKGRAEGAEGRYPDISGIVQQAEQLRRSEYRLGSDFSMHTKFIAEPKWTRTREQALRFRAHKNVDPDSKAATLGEEREKAFADVVDGYLIESGLGVELPPNP